MQIMLNNIDEAKDFVRTSSKCPFELDLEGGAVCIDAKSLLGVITMGVNRKLNLLSSEVDAIELHRLFKRFAAC